MRNYAQIQLSIWNDDDFRDLTAPAQLLYFIMISHPTLNRCGVGDYRPKRLALFSHSWDAHQVEAAATELAQARFVILDTDSEEYLVRTFVRHDGLMKQKNMATTMAREFSTIVSDRIRGVIVWELRRLRSEFPKWRGWESVEALELLERTAVNPSSRGAIDPKIPQFDPSIDPKGDPSVYPPIDPSIDPTVDPSGGGSGDPKGDPPSDPSGGGSGRGSSDPSPTPAPAPAPFTTGGESGAAAVGVKGGTGGEGEDGKTPDATAPTSPPQNLDQLAAAHADRNRCERHKGIPEADVPPCRACQRAREANESHERQADQEARHQRREAIDNCPHCDDNGILMRNGTATRCNHTNPHWTPPKTRPHAPQNDKQDTP